MGEESWRILTTYQVTIPDIASLLKEALQQNFKTLAHKELMDTKWKDYFRILYGMHTKRSNKSS